LYKIQLIDDMYHDLTAFWIDSGIWQKKSKSIFVSIKSLLLAKMQHELAFTWMKLNFVCWVLLLWNRIFRRKCNFIWYSYESSIFLRIKYVF